MTRFIGVFAAAAAVVLMSGTASPQEPPKCPLSRDQILKIALDNYNEGPVQGGEMTNRDGSQYIFELLLSTEGSWTIVRTGTDGQTCAIASGTSWITTGEPPLPGKPT